MNEQHHEGHNEGQKVAIRVVEAEKTPEAKEHVLDVSDFDAQADYIAMTVASQENQADGLKAAHLEYVKEEADPDLKRFGEIMLMSPGAVATKAKAVEYERRPAGSLTEEEERDAARTKRRACTYVQLVTHFVANHEEAMPPDKLEDWIGRAAGSRKFAEKLVNGVVADRATTKLLHKVPGLKNVRPGDLDDDLHGKDIVFDRTPAGYSAVDAKSREIEVGKTEPVMRVEKQRKLVVNIDPRFVDRKKYEVRQHLQDGYIRELENKLGL